MWGIRAFCRFCPEERGALVGDSFNLLPRTPRAFSSTIFKMADRRLIHSRKDFWVHFGTFEQIRADTSGHKCGICGIRFIVIQVNTSIKYWDAEAFLFRCSVKRTFLNVADISYAMLWLKLPLKQTAEIQTFPFWPKSSHYWRIFAASCFRLIFLVFETLPSQRKIMFSSFSSSF